MLLRDYSQKFFVMKVFSYTVAKTSCKQSFANSGIIGSLNYIVASVLSLLEQH